MESDVIFKWAQIDTSIKYDQDVKSELFILLSVTRHIIQ